MDYYKAYYHVNRIRILARQKAWAKANRAEITKRQAVYFSTPVGKAANYRKTRAWAKRNPDKRRAHEMVKDALRRGALVRQPCDCGEQKSQAHHHDYQKPLDVRWLCRSCHRRKHEIA